LGPVDRDDFFNGKKPKPAIIPANGTTKTLLIAERPARKVVVIDYPDPNPPTLYAEDYDEDILDEEADRINFEEVLAYGPFYLTTHLRCCVTQFKMKPEPFTISAI
jgi:hypothetical protein